MDSVTTADGVLTVEGDRLSVGVPHAAGLPAGFLLVFGVTPMAILALGLLLAVAPGSAAGALLLLLLSAAMVFLPGVSGVLLIVLSERAGRRREVRIDLGERLIQRSGGAARPLSQPDAIRLTSHGLGWRLSMDDEVLVRGPYLLGHSLASAATRLAEAMECELYVSPAARRARVPVPRDPRMLAALAYLPFDPVSVPLSLWILATSTHAKARFAARQSLVLEVVEGTLGALLLSVAALPLLLLESYMPKLLALMALFVLIFGVLLMRTLLRSALCLRAGSGIVTVVFGLGWLLGRWAPRSAKSQRTPRRRPQPPKARAHRPGPPPARAPAGGLGPWWT